MFFSKGLAARHHCGAGHESRINPNNLRQVRGSIFSLPLVWFSGDMKSERPSKDDEQHCRCVVCEEKTVLQSLDVAFSAPSRKSSFLRVLLSCEGGRWLALLQGDSRVGRARIRKILALAEWELSSLTGLARYWMPNRYKWWVVRHAFVPCVRGQALAKDCMCACVRTFVTCWEVLRAVDQTETLLWHCICSIFCSLFVILLCRKPEIESLESHVIDCMVLVGRLAWTSATCTYFRVAEKFTTAKRKAGTLYHAKSFGIPSICSVVA